MIHAEAVTFFVHMYSAFQPSLFPRNAHWTKECSPFEICRYKRRRVDKNDITDEGVIDGAQFELSDSSYPRLLGKLYIYRITMESDVTCDA